MMTDWTAGYVADIGYTFGYYQELNPLRADLALLHANLAPPQILTACELGFGQGLSANIHAATTNVQWYGTDFNPSQAAFARDLAEASGAAIKLWDDSFAEFANRPDLPDFDFIALHGIWSWISDENRAVIVDFIRRKLKVGGLLYVSYNTLPGWAAFAPVRHLMTEHAETLGARGRGMPGRIDDAVAFADRLLKTNPRFGAANPSAAERLQSLQDMSHSYLAHEYFNRDWHPMHFSAMADWLAPAKLSYACSATYNDHLDPINLTPEQKSFLQEIPDPIFREGVRDFMVNQYFRRDYWIKGQRQLSALDRDERLRQITVQMVVPRDKVVLLLKGALGEATIKGKLYDLVLDSLASQKPKTLGQIEQDLAAISDIKLANITEAVLALASNHNVMAVQGEQAIAAARKQSDRLNREILERARGSDEIGYLASPVFGGATSLPRLQQLFLLALVRGSQAPKDWALLAWGVLSAQGQKLAKDGKTIESDEGNIVELTAQAEQFAKDVLPSLKLLGIV